jgi:hypothetical protein
MNTCLNCKGPIEINEMVCNNHCLKCFIFELSPEERERRIAGKKMESAQKPKAVPVQSWSLTDIKGRHY